MASVKRAAQPEDFRAVKFVLADHEWLYRGEGNANLAICLPLEKKVIRFPKFKHGEDFDELDLWQWLSSNIIFITSIMKPLLGSMFVSPPSLVYVSSDDIKRLNETLTATRPENRKNKALCFGGAELHEDHAFLPHEFSQFCMSKSLSVELKPKQGVFPYHSKQLNCAFCCKQYLKLREGIVTEPSQYCPLDLFSGCHARMKHAIVSLLHSPQNNLRVFCDGHFVYGEGHSINTLETVLTEWLCPVPELNLVERFSSLLVQALTKKVNTASEASTKSSLNWVYDSKPFDSKHETHSNTHRDASIHLPRPPCNYEKQPLPDGCILFHLAKAQALETMSTSSVRSLVMANTEYERVITAQNCLRSASTNYVNDIVRKGCSSKLNPIELYLIAAAARDCSILITFQEVKRNCPEVYKLPLVEDNVSNTHYCFKISAVDIDPKPLSCINAHMKRNASIQQACSDIAV